MRESHSPTKTKEKKLKKSTKVGRAIVKLIRAGWTGVLRIGCSRRLVAFNQSIPARKFSETHANVRLKTTHSKQWLCIESFGHKQSSTIWKVEALQRKGYVFFFTICPFLFRDYFIVPNLSFFPPPPWNPSNIWKPHRFFWTSTFVNSQLPMQHGSHWVLVIVLNRGCCGVQSPAISWFPKKVSTIISTYDRLRP